ncbi:MAG: NAD-dependent epimerase/dehydratase family protein [Saccharofermentans sp.]|nr:NAD-dependent epimerase/dehydratase family protein [Saccharofermentans sp.]
MYQKYLVTGALQPVGKLVVELLLEEGKSVRVLVPPEADISSLRGLDVEIIEGEIFDKDSMKEFFTLEDPRHSAIIHTEEIVSISDETNINMRRINVTGSNNVIDQCLKTKIGRVICLGSAYAINPKSARENSVMSFDRTKVEGDYAKSKAEAAAYVMEKVSLNKMNASILLPSFIIGPGFSDDYDINKILKSYLEKGVSPIKGGHAFVDVRDVAMALSAICEEGQAGGCYVLNGEHKTTEDFFAEVSKANGSDTPLKIMPKWTMGKRLGKFVDTYYRIAKKDNPKEVYALFMNAPDQTFDSTVNDMLPNGQVRTVYESIDDVIHKVKVNAGDLVQKPATALVEEVQEAPAEVVEEVVEEAPKSILNIPSVLGTLNSLSLNKTTEMKPTQEPVVEEPVVEEAPVAEEAPAPQVEEPAEDAPTTPIWAKPIDGNIESLDDLDDL